MYKLNRFSPQRILSRSRNKGLVSLVIPIILRFYFLQSHDTRSAPNRAISLIVTSAPKGPPPCVGSGVVVQDLPQTKSCPPALTHLTAQTKTDKDVNCHQCSYHDRSSETVVSDPLALSHTLLKTALST